MTTNKPEVQAILVTCTGRDGETVLSRAVRLIENHDPSCVNQDWNYEPLVRLSDYEDLVKVAKELVNWCVHEVGVDIDITPGLKQVMDITGVVYDEE